MNTKLFGERINLARKDSGLTSEKLAELLNINATYLRQIEGGKKVPSLAVFISICKTLKVSSNYLLYDDIGYHELYELPQFIEFWSKATPRQTELVIAMINTVLEKLQKI